MLSIDSSTPAVATGNQTATTASFTPPAGSLLLIGFSGNNDDWPQFPTAPTITDNLGSHLTYTIWDWQCGGGAGALAVSRPSTGAEGQTAFWVANVITSAAMTVSVTNNTTLGQSQCAVQVWVILGADAASPVGAHGFNGSSSASSIAQSYTAQIDDGQGFLAVCDWAAVGTETAGTGCTLDASGSIGAPDVSYGFNHRTTADDSNGGLTTLNMTLPSSSSSVNWTYIELKPGTSDPAEKDPPPFINFYAPGGLAPNGTPTPWLGTDTAAPPATGVIIDGSSPLTVLNTAGTATGLTTASFTPPTNSLLLILWSGNSIDPTNPSTPTITDSLGAPLTYTLSDWQSRASSPTVDGQAAIWTAPVTTAAPMTVTVNNNAASPNRHAALTVLVLIDPSGTRPTVGAHGKSGSTSASLIAQAYTAQATGGQGFIAYCDWNAVGDPVEGTDCYPVRPPLSSGTIPTQISYGHFKRTIPDDVNAVSNRLNVTLPSASTTLNWAYLEILPAVSSGIAETGSARVTVSATGAAAKVAVQSGSCAAPVRTSGTASKTVSRGGTSAVAVTATGRGARVAVEAGSAAIAVRTSGIAVNSRVQSGSCSVAARSTGAASKVVARGGSAEIAVRSTGVATKITPQSGSASVAVTTTGQESSGSARPQGGSCSIAVRTSASATKTVARGATAAVAVRTVGAASKVVAAAGTASIAVRTTGQETSGTARVQSGSCSIAVRSSGVNGKTVARGGSAVVAVRSSGAASKVAARGGTASIAVRTSGLGARRAPEGGSASVAVAPAGLGAKRTALSGSARLAVSVSALRIPPVTHVPLGDRLEEILNTLISFTKRLAIFDSVQGHEPKSPPRNGLHAALWLQTMMPAVGQSSLDSTSIRIAWYLRIYQNFLSRPEDAIDPKVMRAMAAVMEQLSGNFDLDLPGVRAIDLLGMTGPPMGAEAGYVPWQDGKIHRCMTLTIPIIVDDVFAQVA